MEVALGGMCGGFVLTAHLNVRERRKEIDSAKAFMYTELMRNDKGILLIVWVILALSVIAISFYSHNGRLTSDSARYLQLAQSY